jgi:hypothetical protein
MTEQQVSKLPGEALAESAEPVRSSAVLGDMVVGAVVVLDPGRYDLPRPVKIDRVTGTQIIIGSERFRRDSGYKIGESGGWSRTRISVPEPGEIEKCRVNLKRRRLAGELREVQWGTLPLKTLESVAAAVKAGMSPNDPKLSDSGGLARRLRGRLCGEQPP